LRELGGYLPRKCRNVTDLPLRKRLSYKKLNEATQYDKEQYCHYRISLYGAHHFSRQRCATACH